MRRFHCPPGILVLVLLLSGCLGILSNVPTPETPRERLAILEIDFQEANRAIQDLIAAGTLHGEPAANVVDLLKAFHVALQAVRVGIDDPDGLVLLVTANKALIALTTRLEEAEQ